MRSAAGARRTRRARRSMSRASCPTAPASWGVAELKRALLANPEPFLRTLTEKLLTYALGRGLEYTDAPAVRRIVRDAASREHRFSALGARHREERAVPAAAVGRRRAGGGGR